MNEECIIRKLVADGDGGGDDRRFVTILTLLLKLIKEPEPSQRFKKTDLCSSFKISSFTSPMYLRRILGVFMKVPKMS